MHFCVFSFGELRNVFTNLDSFPAYIKTMWRVRSYFVASIEVVWFMLQL
jgi:hypothetical protein